MRLEGTYARIHNYIRETKDIDPAKIMEATKTTPAEMEIILELGWMERDIQTYTDTVTERRKLAKEFAEELAKMVEHHKATTYGGVYQRYKNRRKRKK